MAVLAAENVSYTYQSKYQKVQALKNVSCTFETGKFYAIIGQSGSGKTTLLSMLAGLGTPSEGEIIANGKTLKEIGSERHRRENVTVIYQSFNLFPDFEHTRKCDVPDADYEETDERGKSHGQRNS